jgi:cellulose synthase/poly-beta-1,6-N-acetylglucosamine synthase-like glycosyltransferase
VTYLGWTLVSLPIAVGIYAYAGYPAILWLLARRSTTKETAPREWPSVMVILPAYNEEHQIGGAIDALLAQDYPRDKLHIMVVSDASTDGTDRIVSEYASEGVELLRMPQRGGKTKGENRAATLIESDIVVNTDASIRLHPSAIRELMRAMSDPSVGVASGRDMSISHMGTSANLTEAGYVQYEMRVRALETRTGGIVGASGSCYAIRTVIHRIPIRDDLSRDFSAALTAHAHGYRAVSVDSAVCFVPRTASLRREYHRKVRTISRGMDTLYANRALLDPSGHGLFAWKLISHKVCRWLLPFLIIPAAAGLLILSLAHSWPLLVLIAGALLAAMATVGALWPETRSMPRLISVAAFGVSANLAVLVAVRRVLAGGNDYIWEPTRRNATT